MTTLAEWNERLVAWGLPRVSAEQLILAALNRGALVEIGAAKSFDATLVDGEVPQTLVVEEVLRCLPSGLVATAPVAEVGTGIRETREVFALVIAAAQQELLIASPYLDERGVMLLQAPLRTAAKRGVRLRLLSRELKVDETRPFRELIGPRARSKGIRLLADWFGEHFQAADYYYHDGTRQLAALHAKIVQADDTLGYVGSAEIREYALRVNFEMGYVFHAANATACRTTFESIWSAAILKQSMS